MRAAEFMRALADIIDSLEGEDLKDQPSKKDPSELDQNPVFVPPLQQQIELTKAEQGKESPIIDKLLSNDNIGQEPNQLNK